MARPAGFAKQYSSSVSTALVLVLVLARAGIETGTVACSPFWAVSCRLAWHAAAPSGTASCVEATSVTLSVPHSSGADPAASGVEAYISHRPELAPEDRIRGRAGAVTE